MTLTTELYLAEDLCKICNFTQETLVFRSPISGSKTFCHALAFGFRKLAFIVKFNKNVVP